MVWFGPDTKRNAEIDDTERAPAGVEQFDDITILVLTAD
jgi:hypothetical protein